MARHHLTLLAALISLVLSAQSVARTGPGSSGFQVNATTGSMKEAALAVAPDGNVTFVWKNKISETNEEIWARRFDSAGSALGGEFQINSTVGKNKAPAIVVASDGSFVVVWERKIDDSASEVLARRFDPMGAALDAEFQINETTGKMKKPTVAMATDDSFTVVWNNSVSDTTEEIWAKQFDDKGDAIGGQFKINASAGKHKKPNVTVDSNGNIVVAWEFKVSEGVSQILARRFDDSGVALSGEYQINATSGDMKEPAIATAPDNTVVVAWVHKAGDNDEELWARRFDENGNAISGDFQINSTSGKHKKPRIAVASDGGFAIAWEHKVTDSDSPILTRRFDALGNALAGEYQVNPSTGKMKDPDIAAAPDDTFIVVWNEKIAENDEQVWARYLRDIMLEETVTGGTTGTSPVTLLSVYGGVDQTYVLAIATKGNNDVTGVSGGGLSWVEQVEQCATTNTTAMRIWTAQGSPSAAFQVQINYEAGLPLTAVLSRYFGVGAISDPTGENPDGESGSCTSGAKTLNPQLTLTSTNPRSVHVVGIAPGDKAVSSVFPGYTLNGNSTFGGGSNATRTYLYERMVDPANTETFDATLTGSTWWATGGVVLSPGTPSSASTVFSDVSSLTGFDVQTSGTQPSALHFADFDNDGDCDAIITGQSSSRYLANLNEGQSFNASVFGGGNRKGQGGMIDIDNDGDIDFWHTDEKLFNNDGGALFSDAGALGFTNATSTKGTATADVNNDGYADLVMFSTNGNWIGFHNGKVVPVLNGTDDPSYGLVDAGSAGPGAFVAAGDVNDDGRLDFYYHYNGGKLFLSQSDGTFVQNASGIVVSTAPNKPVGATFGDYDNDGDLDLYVPQYDAGSFGTLWRNDSGTFTDVALAAGITNSTGQRGAAFGDFDNDGDLDLYIGTDSATNVLYKNQGDGTFIETYTGASILGDTQDVVFVDFDNDGDLDIAMTQENATNILLQNTTNNANYLKVRVIGHGAAMTNKAAIGVRVELYAADGTTFIARREIGVASGFGGTQPMWLHFGGVDPAATYVVKAFMAHQILSVAITPGAVSTTIGSTTIPQMLTLTETAPQLAGWREIGPQ